MDNIMERDALLIKLGFVEEESHVVKCTRKKAKKCDTENVPIRRSSRIKKKDVQ